VYFFFVAEDTIENYRALETLSVFRRK